MRTILSGATLDDIETYLKRPQDWPLSPSPFPSKIVEDLRVKELNELLWHEWFQKEDFTDYPSLRRFKVRE